MLLINVLQNDKGVVRVTYSATPLVHYAVKFFDASNEFYTVKVWIGKDIANIQKYWSTKTPVVESKAKVFADEAREKILKAPGLFQADWINTNKLFTTL